MSESPFLIFCRYIDKEIFSEDNRGDVVRFVVDKVFMENFCKETGVSEDNVMSAASRRLYYYTEDILEIKGLLAIQTYAACRRASGAGYSSRNFRIQLSLLLGWEMKELQKWMVDHQEDYWDRLFQWCEENDYIIPTCRRTWGNGRYTQYPLGQTRGVFTTEELKYIARAFYDKGLHPDEDLTLDEFWEVVCWEELGTYLYTPHAKSLYSSANYKADAQQQIYGFFNRWDGEYLERTRYGKVGRGTETTGKLLYMDKALEHLIVADRNRNDPVPYALAELSYQSYQSEMYGRKQSIVFREDDDYGEWQEVTKLGPDEEGRILVWTGYGSLPPEEETPLASHAYCKIYQVIPGSAHWQYLYANPRPYRLEGGLKIDRDSYLLGGAPLLKIEGKQSFWVDNEHVEAEGEYELLHLREGKHIIRIRGFRPIIIELTTGPTPDTKELSSGGWHVSRHEGAWAYRAEGSGVRGMDFARAGIKQGWAGAEMPILEAWAKLHLHVPTAGVNNIAINTLKNILEHD